MSPLPRLPFPRRVPFHTASFLTIAFVLAGCASLSREQCLQGDWHQIGYADGVAGAAAARINDHAKACADVGVKPDLDAYLHGREQGFQKYCRPANAFDLGRRGAPHNAEECPAFLKPAFYFEYDRGSQLGQIESELAERRAQIDRNHRQLLHHDARIAAIRGELARPDLSNERRTALLNEFNRLVEVKNTLGRDNAFLYHEADRLQLRLQAKLREFGR
jgi:hypothetical protein